MAACVPNLRPLFHRTWDRTASGHGYSGSHSADMDATLSMSRTRQQRGRRESALSRIGADVRLADVGQKEGYAESAESRQGIMRTTEVSVQRCSEEERLSRTENIVPRNLKGGQE